MWFLSKKEQTSYKYLYIICETTSLQPEKMNNMHKYSSKRFGHLCFIFYMVVTNLTKMKLKPFSFEKGNKWNI